MKTFIFIISILLTSCFAIRSGQHPSVKIFRYENETEQETLKLFPDSTYQSTLRINSALLKGVSRANGEYAFSQDTLILKSISWEDCQKVEFIPQKRKEYFVKIITNQGFKETNLGLGYQNLTLQKGKKGLIKIPKKKIEFIDGITLFFIENPNDERWLSSITINQGDYGIHVFKITLIEDLNYIRYLYKDKKLFPLERENREWRIRTDRYPLVLNK